MFFLYLLVDLIAMAGGGGSSSDSGSSSSYDSSSSYGSSDSYGSSGGGGGDESDFGFIIGFVFLISMIVVAIRSYRAKKSKSKRTALDPAKLSPERKAYMDLFKKYQHDWQEKNLDSIKTYTTSSYFQRASLMLRALDDLDRKNNVTIEAVSRITIRSDSEANENMYMRRRVVFTCDAIDSIVNTRTGATLSSNNLSGYTETWFFDLSTGTPLLDQIMPATLSLNTLQKNIQDFAEQNQMFYSPDWGSLLLPTRGAIFARSTFRTADINNHVIGLYQNHLIQLYTYSPNTNNQVNNAPYPQYLVGQITVPGKNYGGILVMPNKIFSKKPKGYQKYQLEWEEFNEKYAVFATDPDKFASFELLNPSFMQFLHDQINEKITLEVVDNIIYFYVKDSKNINPKNYQIMLEVLRRAYKELKR